LKADDLGGGSWSGMQDLTSKTAEVVYDVLSSRMFK